MGERTCTIEGCGHQNYVRGWCNRHYLRWKRHGDPLGGAASRPSYASDEERFWAKVDRSGDCWIWTAGTNAYGYGSFRVDDFSAQAHRFAYELLVGPIPEGLLVDHRCFNTRCVNPAHLRLATQKQNGENRQGPQRNSTSGIRGVSWSQSANKWRAQVGHEGRIAYYGYFDSKEDAEAAVIANRNALFTHSQDQ